MRLIDADELPHYDGTALSAVEVARAVIYAPTIEGRNKGKWKVCGTFDDFLKCSCCGYKKPWNEDVFNFCPTCGADMRG